MSRPVTLFTGQWADLPFETIAEKAAKQNTTIAGAFLEGDNIYLHKLPEKTILVMGNEGNGISPEIEKQVSKKVKIPTFNSSSDSAESLNVSVATAILCSEFKRQIHFVDYSK